MRTMKRCLPEALKAFVDEQEGACAQMARHAAAAWRT